MPFSPFVSILKVYCGPKSNLPLRQIRTLLHSFVAPSYLFQTETSASPLEALIESLSSLLDQSIIDAVLSFLDETIARCIRSPFKYIDDYAELALDTAKTKHLSENLPAVSPFTMTVVEQWKFFMQSKHPSNIKFAASNWLARFLESSAILGENVYILAVLCERLAAICDESEHRAGKTVFKRLRRQLKGENPLELKDDDGDDVYMEDDSNTRPKWPRGLLDGLGRLDINKVESVTNSIREKEIEVSLFDISVAQKAILGVLESQKINCEDSCSALSKLMKLHETILARLKEEGETSATWKEARNMLVNNGGLIRSFLGVPQEENDFPKYAYFSKSKQS